MLLVARVVRVHSAGELPHEVADLVAFMQSLTDESFVNNPKFANPFLNGRKLTPAEHGRR